MATSSLTEQSAASSEVMVIYNVRRYGAAGRFYHWVHAACMMLFISTGWQIHTREVIFGDIAFIRTLHISLGIFILFWDLLCQSTLLAIDHHLKDILPTPQDIRDLIVMFLCTLGIISDEHYPHYDFYDPELGVYVRKYHPGQKLLAVTDIIMMIFMGSTGIALAETQQPGSTGMMAFFAIFNAPIRPFLEIVGINLRFVHFLLFTFFTLTTTFHIYFALIPQNFSRLKAMITGKESIKQE